MESLFRDVRYGARLLWKDKGFTLTALATLALCIGANTAVFTVVNSVLLRPLPAHESDRILLLHNSYPKAGVARAITSAGDYYDRLRELTVFENRPCTSCTERRCGERGSVEQLLATWVSPLLPPASGEAAAGAHFTEDEGELGGERKVVLSYGLWQRQGADPNIVGKICASRVNPTRWWG